MRKLAQASTALLLSSTTTAMAAGVDSSFGEARLYWRTSFAEQSSQATAMQFGASLDYDRRYINQTLPGQPAAQVNFDRNGFVSASMNGLPFARRVAMQQAEGGAAVSYTVVDYTLLALGAAGVGYGISEVVNQRDTPDAASPGTPPGQPPAQPPSGPSLPGAPAGSPSLPGAPAGSPSLPGAPAGSPSLPGAPLSGGYASYEERAVTPEYQQWLDAGTGGMGDLVLIKE